MKSLASTAISILDLAKVSDGKTIAQTFAQSREIAQHAERLGFTRFWLAEHHNIEGIASAATPVLIAHIAENTKTIRVGSGGIMLPNHAPLVIAETFGTLSTLYPQRIDLGLGRAPGSDQLTMRAIRGGVSTRETDFGDLVHELMFYLAPAEPGQRVRAIPGAGVEVPLYILGSSLYSARLAAHLGRPYAFAGHFAPQVLDEALAIYRNEFHASSVLAKPYVMVGVPVIAAESDAHAAYLATSVQQAFLGLVRGDRRLSAPPIRNIDGMWSTQERLAVHSMLSLLISGGPLKVREDLDALIRRTGADELIITSDTFDHADRMRSLELIALAKSYA